MTFIIIGNIISFAAASFMALSCLAHNIKKVFIYQFLECILLAIASFFFGTYAAIATLLLSAVRNMIVAYGKFKKPEMIIFIILVGIIGILTNNRGFIGLMPIIATIEYTVCCYYIKGVYATKISILVNVLIWVLYSFIILDFSTAISDSIVGIVDIIAIFKGLRNKSVNKY